MLMPTLPCARNLAARPASSLYADRMFFSTARSAAPGEGQGDGEGWGEGEGGGGGGGEGEGEGEGEG